MKTIGMFAACATVLLACSAAPDTNLFGTPQAPSASGEGDASLSAEPVNAPGTDDAGRTSASDSGAATGVDTGTLNPLPSPDAGSPSPSPGVDGGVPDASAPGVDGGVPDASAPDTAGAASTEAGPIVIVDASPADAAPAMPYFWCDVYGGLSPVPLCGSNMSSQVVCDSPPAGVRTGWRCSASGIYESEGVPFQTSSTYPCAAMSDCYDASLNWGRATHQCSSNADCVGFRSGICLQPGRGAGRICDVG